MKTPLEKLDRIIEQIYNRGTPPQKEDAIQLIEWRDSSMITNKDENNQELHFDLGIVLYCLKQVGILESFTLSEDKFLFSVVWSE